MKRWSTYLWLCAALVCAGCVQPPLPATGDDDAPAPAAVQAFVTAAPELTAGWQTYTDPEAGYSVRYPPGVHFSAGQSKAGIYTARIQFRIPGVDGYQGMLIRVEPNPTGQGLEQVVGEFYRRFAANGAAGQRAEERAEERAADLLAGLEQVTVAGLSGVQVGTERDFSLVLPYGDRVFIIAPVHDLVTTGLDPQALALFYEVLATLQLEASR
jgi:hypothetical protein